MKILDSWVNQSSFKQDSDGNDLFFPWGVLGRGYILDSTETKQKIFNFLRLYLVVTFAFLGLWAFIINPYMISLVTAREDFPIAGDIELRILVAELPLALVLIAMSFIWFYAGIKPFIKTLPHTNVKLGWAESYTASAKATPAFFLWFGFIFSILAVLIIPFLIFQDLMSMIMGLFSLIVFGLMIWGYGYMISVRNKPS